MRGEQPCWMCQHHDPRTRKRDPIDWRCTRIRRHVELNNVVPQDWLDRSPHVRCADANRLDQCRFFERHRQEVLDELEKTLTVSEDTDGE